MAAAVLFAAASGLTAQSAAPPKELVQYIRDAKKAGLNDSDILKNAERAGWPPDLMKAAMGDAKSVPAEAVPGQPALPRPSGSAKTAAETATHPAAIAGPAKTPESTSKTYEASTTAPTNPAPTIPAAAKDRGAPDDYEIGAGDVLSISVWKEPDASVQSTVVRPDGKISMPLLKEVPVLGLKIVQAEQLITQELARYITAPDVTVVVSAIHSKKVYVTGAVKKEGPIPYTYRMTVLQALSEAGGLTDYAKRKKIYVLHDDKGRQFLFPFDYDAALKGLHMELNRFLTPGDMIVVPH